VRHQASKLGRALARPFRRHATPAAGTALLAELFGDSCRARVTAQPQLLEALARGIAPLGEHGAMFELVSGINRDVATGIADSVRRALAGGQFGGLFDALSAVAAHQFVLLPYYFALSHQNRERNDLARITGHGGRRPPEELRVGVFTDTFDEVNGVVRFVRDMAAQARRLGRQYVVHTCTDAPSFPAAYRRNFAPLVSCAMPMYPQLKLALPPLLEILEWADRQQFDAIHLDTPGPMGLCGWLVAKMLRVPVLATYHTDLPEYVRTLSGGDYRLTSAAAGYVRWFYGQAAAVFSRGREYQKKLGALGVEASRLRLAPPCVDDDKFNPRHRDVNLWSQYGVREPHRLLFCGRVSREKNLAFLAETFRQLCRRRSDVALVIAGDGPYLPELRKALKDVPAYFLGFQGDAALAPLYASSELLVFPSRTDTLGQVVLEAQASGLPVLVSTEGGPREVVDDHLTGRILPAADVGIDVPKWLEAIEQLLDDEALRQRLGRTAATRVARYTAAAAFEAFWDEIVAAARGTASDRGVASTRDEAFLNA
jgi:glycosyltransferase involved in cell wall biosynthesis